MQIKRAGRSVLRLIVWLLLGFVFFRGVISFLPQPPARAAEPQAEVKQSAEPAGLRAIPALFAREFLTWEPGAASDRAERLRPYLAPGIDRQAGWEPAENDGGQRVEDSHVYEIVSVSPTRWRVVIAARVVSFRSNGKERQAMPARTVYLSVPVGKTEGGWVVYDFPTLLPEPTPTAFDEPLFYGKESSDTGGRVKTLLTDYFRAYLSGGELAYYLVPGKQIRSMNPGWTFQQVARVRLVAADNGVWALADVAVVDASSGTRYLYRYTLQVVERDGRWLIADVLQGGG